MGERLDSSLVATMWDDRQVRAEALSLAVSSAISGPPIGFEQIIERAEKFRNYIEHGSPYAFGPMEVHPKDAAPEVKGIFEKYQERGL